MTTDIFTTDDASGFELDPRPARVLVFGSHLAFGSVGLNAGLPVYDEARIRCAAIPTIVLSNLPHYPSVQTVDVSAVWITASLRDLAAAGLLAGIEAVAVGYLASPDQARAIAAWYRGLDEEARPPLILDPTFGDADVGFYTDPAVAPALRESLVPLASVLTPNLFELAHLTADGSEVRPVDTNDVDAIARRARDLPTAVDADIVVTGVHPADDQIANVIVRAGALELMAGEEIPTSAKGLGDAFTAALVVALLSGSPLLEAVDGAGARVRRAISGGS
ncbi:bifunctional hydroxymethylpyrimidine kinase/phosphomethylpyrimidine kinase [Gordonia phthalatica]|uniref:bifunctional hydroxymethylpyrimidine kinase/phosphomethylpyrimidine kinase n=1 Tax=Gordonia phthalatica TaxID=1136941 RepID=UPI000782D502|nr:bifunctional hydroxymethylpyrimidine kinase/phosphomethylpyrimidine kinase [Gordonia phthalatica]